MVILELDVFTHYKLYTCAYTSPVSLSVCFFGALVVPEYW